MKLPKLTTVLSYLTGAATLLVVADSKVTELPFGLPPSVLTWLAGAAMVAKVVLHFTKAPSLTPTPTDGQDDLSPDVAKAAGTAGAAAAKGPFVKG